MKKNISSCLFGISFFCGIESMSQEVKNADVQTNLKDTSNRSFLYYAMLGFKKVSADTIFLEDDVFLFINRNNKRLYLSKPGQPNFLVPETKYNDLSSFIFESFLADDKYKVLKRMSEMKGLLENSKIGIDIASHQSGKAIDWKKVKGDTLHAPIGFVCIRAIRGYDNSYDPKFEEHYASVSASNYPIGFYHNFVLNKTHRADFMQHAKEQAYKFVEAFKGRKVAFKPVLDIEVDKKFAVVEGQFCVKEIKEATCAFIDIVEKELKTQVIIYTFESFYMKYLRGAVDNRNVWIARYPNSPDFAGKRIYPGSKNPFLGISYDFAAQKFNYTLKTNAIGWQFSADGHVDGISSNVDLNIILNKDYEKWLWK